MMIKGVTANKINGGWNTYFLKMKVVLSPGSGVAHEARAVDTAVSQAAAVGEVSLEFFPVSSAEDRKTVLARKKDCKIVINIKIYANYQEWDIWCCEKVFDPF